MNTGTQRGPSAKWLVLVLLAGCDGASNADAWQQQGWSELVAQSNAVLDAVDALPECAGLRSKGGIIHWQTQVSCGSPLPVIGCTYPRPRSPVVQVEFESAWGINHPDKSTLAHELCHACGYTDEHEAEACAQRAHVNYVPPKAQARVAPSDRPEATAALVEAAGSHAADAVRRGELAEARQVLEGALRAIDPGTRPAEDGLH